MMAGRAVPARRRTFTSCRRARSDAPYQPRPDSGAHGKLPQCGRSAAVHQSGVPRVDAPAIGGLIYDANAELQFGAPETRSALATKNDT